MMVLLVFFDLDQLDFFAASILKYCCAYVRCFYARFPAISTRWNKL